MKTRTIVLASSLLWITLCCILPGKAEEAAAPAKAPRNVVLIGWDGAQREHVFECLARGELPNLKKLGAEGVLTNIDVVGTTDTKAGWSEILTGYGPKNTGVYSNGRFQPIPLGYTIFERFRRQFGADKVATVAVIGKDHHVGGIAPPRKVKIEEEEKAVGENGDGDIDQHDIGGANDDKPEKGRKKRARDGKKQDKSLIGSHVVVEDGVRYRVTPGEPYYNTYTNVDVWLKGLRLDSAVGRLALENLEKYKDRPFFFFVHFAEIDTKGHGFGENSKEYTDALISADTWTGRILAKLKELNLLDNTTVYVTSDHGFDEGQKHHKNAPSVIVATNDKGVIRGGNRADVGATVLERLGIDLGKITPPLDGKPLTLKPAP